MSTPKETDCPDCNEPMGWKYLIEPRCFKCNPREEPARGVNPIETVQNWIDTGQLAATDIPALQAVVEHAKLSDEYIRMIYRVIGWMYKDASGIMALGLTDTYRGLSIDQVFSRVCK